MKVMLLTPVPLKKLAKEFNWPMVPTGGWIDGLSEALTTYYRDECELIFVFTHVRSSEELRGKISLGGGKIFVHWHSD